MDKYATFGRHYMKGTNELGIKGVYPSGTRFRAQVTHEYVSHYLGTFDTKEKAKEAVDKFMENLPDKGPLVKKPRYCPKGTSLAILKRWAEKTKGRKCTCGKHTADATSDPA